MLFHIRQSQLFQLISAHFKEIIRQPAVIFWGIIFPILMALGLGIAFSRPADIVRHVAVIENHPAGFENTGEISPVDAVLEKYAENPAPPGQEDQITLLDDTLGTTTFIFEKTDWRSAIVGLKRGTMGIIMEVRDQDIYYHFDPASTDAHFIYLKLSRLFDQTAAAKDPASGRNVQPLTVPGTRYIDFLVPGLMAMSIMMSCMWGLSYGMIDKRAKKLLRRMVATPMKKSYFLISLMTVRITMNLIECALLFLVAWVVFDITIQGSIFGLFAIFLSANIAFCGIAIFVSCRTANTEIGNGLVNAVVMPMMVLSGVFFSYHNFPEWSIPVIQKLPLTMLTDGLRGIFIEGATLVEMLLPATVLLVIGSFFFSVGLRLFKWH